MKKTVLLLASLFVMALATQQLSAQSADAVAKATIVKSISIEKNADLNFGKIIAGSSAGTVAVQNDGTRTFTGGVALFNQGDDHQVASFKGIGSPNVTFFLTLPSSISLTGPSGSTPMTVDGFVHNATGTLSDIGENLFNVGATLHVGANQTVGEYTGTFTVTAAYN